MKKTIALICGLFAFTFSVEAAEIIDAEGNRVFYTHETGQTQEDQGLLNGQVVTTVYNLESLIHTSGKAFNFDFKWEVITSNGSVFMDYNYNKRQWKWVEGSGVKPNQSAKGDAIRRLYNEEELIDPVTGNYEGEFDYTTPEQGDRPFMTFKNGQYFNEFGEVIYTLKGQRKKWWNAIIAHTYYEEFYGSTSKEDLQLLRGVAEDELGNLNSIAQEMITIGKQSTRTFGGPYEMIYFVDLGDTLAFLSENQVSQLKNKWLILNEKTRRGSAPRIIPEGGFYVKKNDAQKRGIEGVSGKNFVLEIKIKPEYIAEFKSEVLQK